MILGIIAVHRRQFGIGNAQRVQLFEKIVDLVRQELFLAQGENPLAGTRGHKIADTPLVVDDALRLELVERTHHRVGIHLHHGGILAHRGNAAVFGKLSHQHFVADAVGNLQINSFRISKIHTYQRLMISASFKR